MEKKTKVLHVLTDRNIGGAGRWLLYYLKYHNREKFEVKVLLPHDSLLAEAVEGQASPSLDLRHVANTCVSQFFLTRWQCSADQESSYVFLQLCH